MRNLLAFLVLLAACVGVDASAAPAAAGIHVDIDAGDQGDHGARLHDELAAANLPVTASVDQVDSALMPFVSQVRYYGEADRALAERVLPLLQRYRSRAVLVPAQEGGTVGRIDVYVSMKDDMGDAVALQVPPRAPAPPRPASITDATLRLVFDPEDRSHDPLKGAPPAARAFLAAAKQADTVADDLQRCLAYPDLPGSAWSPAVVQALCAYGNAPVLTAAEARDLLARSDAAGLDARLAASLARLYAGQAARSETIQREIEDLAHADDAADLVRAWREQAPRSAFALAVQASYLEKQAWQARGDDTIERVTAPQLVRMRALANEAIAAAQAALAIEPKLMPARVALVELAQLVGDDELGAKAMREATALDAGNYPLNRARMNALRPRWGGSFAAMDALAATLAAQAGTRPLLAVVAAMPDGERGLVARESDDYPAMARVLLPRVASVPAPDGLRVLGDVYPSLIPDGRWAGLAYLLEAVRFGDCDPCTRNALANHLMGLAGDRDWALVHLQREVQRHPGDLVARTLVGRVLFEQERHAEAIEVLQAVLAQETDPANRRDALDLLVAASRASGQGELADRYSKQLEHEGARPDGE